MSSPTPLTIDLTPTWSAIVPMLVMGLESGSSVARQAAMTELERMAKLADAYVAANTLTKG